MLLTVLREKFKFSSSQEAIEHCLDKFGFTFIMLTKIFQESGKLDEVPDIDRKAMFNLDNWKLNEERTEILNKEKNMHVSIPSKYRAK